MAQLGGLLGLLDRGFLLHMAGSTDWCSSQGRRGTVQVCGTAAAEVSTRELGGVHAWPTGAHSRPCCGTVHGSGTEFHCVLAVPPPPFGAWCVGRSLSTFSFVIVLMYFAGMGVFAQFVLERG
jgi:hypothetical protein